MIFAHPELLWLAGVALPLLLLFLWWSWRKRERMVKSFIPARLLAELTIGVSKTRRKIRLGLLAATALLLFLTLAQPRWGSDLQEVESVGLDMIVAIDTSRSMLASDTAPDRITRAKLAALDLATLTKSDRLGLIAFAGSAFLQCPLTLDDAAFRQSVEAIKVGIIPEGGTAIGEAIQTALDAFQKETATHSVLVLITDGENHETDAVRLAEEASEKGVRIFTVGVGSSNGELIQIQGEDGAMTFLKDASGNVVKSRLNELLLTEIATVANGFYLRLTGADTMKVLNQRGLESLPRSNLGTELILKRHERFQWPLLIAIILLLVETLIPDRTRPRKANPAQPPAPIAATTAILLLAATMVPAFAASPGKAYEKLRSGEYQAAQSDFEELLQKKPEDARLLYNAGAAAYRAGEFKSAAGHFSAATTAQDLSIQQQAAYNLGNTFFRLGEQIPNPNEKMNFWKQALAQYENAMAIKGDDTDAEFNHAFVTKKLEELQQEQQQQDQQQDNSEEQEDQDEQKEQGAENQQNQERDQQDSQEQEEQDQQNQESQEQNEKSDQGEQDPEEQNQEQQQQDGQNQEQEDQEDGQGETSQEQEQPGQQPEGENTQPAQTGEMTQEQAAKMLDALRSKERPLIFLPQKERQKQRGTVKDW